MRRIIIEYGTDICYSLLWIHSKKKRTVCFITFNPYRLYDRLTSNKMIALAKPDSTDRFAAELFPGSTSYSESAHFCMR